MSRNSQSSQALGALREFRERLRSFTLEPERDTESSPSTPPFVRTLRLRSWLDAETIEGQHNVKNIDRLLGDAFQKHYGRHATLPPYNPQDIMRHCPLVFCMLLEADKGHLIDRIMRQQITDKNLCKFGKKELEHQLWTALEPNYTDHHEELFDLFFKRQWEYCPHTFEFDTDFDLHGSVVLPIFKRQQINSREWGTATIHQLCIPEEYLDERMRKRLAGSSFSLESVGTCYYLAVKTFTETGDPNDQARRLFEKERDAYKHLRGQDGMVQYLGAYTHRNADNWAEHNILLEYGDYDLAEYFLFNPPVLSDNVCNFWHNLFSIASALSNLHKFGRVRRGQEETYWGWHADIKPDNILSVKGVLKLADPGFAGFAKLVDGQNAPKTPVTPMTSTYGSPECTLSSRETDAPQAADIWSLGCVFSMAATWLILGPAGLSQYTQLRQNAVKSANAKSRRQRSQRPSTREQLGEGDYFHNGSTVLPEIHEWHDYLRANLRKSDLIAEKILRIIDEKLLQTEPQKRWSAEQLCTVLDVIKRQHPIVQQSELPSAIRKAVTSIEDQQKWKPAAPLWGHDITIQSRKALKSRGYLELPRDDVARMSDMFKERLETAVTKPKLTITPVHGPGGSHDGGITASPGGLSPISDAESAGPALISPRQSLTSPPPKSKSTEGRSKHTAQSIFDAHYAKESDGKKKNESKKLFGMSLPGMLGTNKAKDELLSNHYAERDIKFILDNSASIIPEWQKVRFVLEKLAKKAAYIDSDGMDLEFTNGDRVIKIHEKFLLKEIEEAMDHHRPRPNIETDMKAKLGPILYKWLKAFGSNRPAKPMTLIIFTDGCWKGMTNTGDVENLIVWFNQEFNKVLGAKLLQRYVSIQFVSFGEDPGALYRLRHLDNDLVIDRGIDDIVDTEPWTGDIYKMLLGSLVPDIDLLDEEPEREEVEPVILQRQGTGNTSRQSQAQFQVSSPRQNEPQHQAYTSRRRERSISNTNLQSSNLGVPRNEYHQQIQRRPAPTPVAADPFNSQYDDYRQRPVQRDAFNHYHYPT